MNIPITQRRIFLIPITIVYAIILAVIAIVVSNFPEMNGISYFMFLFSSPFYFVIGLGEQIGALFFVILFPILWVIAVIIATISDMSKRRKYLKYFLVCHYLGALIPFLIQPFGKLFNVPIYSSGTVLILGPLVIYLLGQIWLWRQFKNNSSPNEKQPAA